MLLWRVYFGRVKDCCAPKETLIGRVSYINDNSILYSVILRPSTVLSLGMNIRRLVGTNLRRLRLQRHLSQETLAFEAEVARAYMSGIERGQENPSIEVLHRLALSLGVSVGEFFTPVTEREAGLRNLPRRKSVHTVGRKLRSR